ncbi:MAG: DUF2490 domain-containing protein [Bacteroidales bacterium]|nr:DUF2490 domain-containing protein [Bacteroidales bacterium]
MKRIVLTLSLIMGAACLASAQETSVVPVTADPVYGVKGRFSAEVQQNLGLFCDLKLREEFRTASAGKDDFRKLHSTLAFSYAPLQYFKLGASYTYIGVFKSEFENRHRFRLSATGQVKFGAAALSLKETLQLTHYTRDLNIYQKPHNPLELKSALKFSYNFKPVGLKPYLEAEMRHCFNAVKWESLPTLSYSDAYMNRVRLSLGMEWKINRQNILDFYTLWDYSFDKDIDAKRSGGLKSVTYYNGYTLSFGIAYKFKH